MPHGRHGAAGVLCLAFPGIRRAAPRRPRQPELDALSVPTLVVQGASDPFGMPAPAGATVVTVPGNHALTGDLEALATAVRGWLAEVLGLPD